FPAANTCRHFPEAEREPQLPASNQFGRGEELLGRLAQLDGAPARACTAGAPLRGVLVWNAIRSATRPGVRPVGQLPKLRPPAGSSGRLPHLSLSPILEIPAL